MQLTVELAQRVRVVGVSARHVNDQLASVERNQEGHEGQDETEDDTRLLKAVRQGAHTGAKHGLPAAEDDDEGALLLTRLLAAI